MHLLWWFLIILAVGALLVHLNHVIGRRETEKNIIEAQQTVNRAVQTILVTKGTQWGLVISDDQTVRSTLVANIWGYNVMAFEFQVPYTERRPPQKLQEALNQSLQVYSQEEQLPLLDANQVVAPLVATDIWYDQIKPVVHLEIANVVTYQTLAYLHDLKKLNQPFQT